MKAMTIAITLSCLAAVAAAAADIEPPKQSPIEKAVCKLSPPGDTTRVVCEGHGRADPNPRDAQYQSREMSVAPIIDELSVDVFVTKGDGWVPRGINFNETSKDESRVAVTFFKSKNTEADDVDFTYLISGRIAKK